MLRRISFNLVKDDTGVLTILKQAKTNQQLADLAPGRYKVVIEKEDIDLVRLKKYYFACESNLSRHLGMNKTELHDAMKTIIGQKVNHAGQREYESIADIKDSETMMVRIYEFQAWAADQFDYTFEPYERDETDRDLPTDLTAQL